MKSLRNLVCTVLMTMAMAVAMDDEDTERGSTASRPAVPEEGLEDRAVYCSDPHCFGCNLSRVLAESGSFIRVPSSVQVPLTAVGGAGEPESLNSILRRIIQENRENPMQALDETFGVMVVHLVPVGPIPSANGSSAGDRDPSADDVNK